MTRNRPGRGFTLIEMLAVVGLTGIMLTLCVLTIQGLMAADRSARAEWAEAAALDRLAAGFRRDVHEARKPPEVASDDRVAIDLGGGKSAEYRVKEGNVVVTRTRPGAEGPSVESHKGRRWRAERVEREDLAGRALIRLVFRPAARAGDIEMPIEASVGSEVMP
ncbi:MAG: type II secretion system protein [Isosphaeraceae bacterium]